MNMVINGSSTMNVITKSIGQRCHLKVERHPHPFKVNWVNKANLTITCSCKVPVQIASHKDEILCNVLLMNFIHILLGRHWFYFMT